MQQLMIKLAPDHYIVVDDTPIEIGDWCYNYSGVDGTDEPKIIQATENAVKNWQDNMTFNRGGKEVYLRDNLKRITHSTKPLAGGYKFVYGSEGKIELSEVKELLGEVDVNKQVREKSYQYSNNNAINGVDAKIVRRDYANGYLDGYSQCLEDNKDKKYTEEDIYKVIEMARETEHVINGHHEYGIVNKYLQSEIIQSLQPKTQWEVEFIDGKLKLK